VAFAIKTIATFMIKRVLRRRCDVFHQISNFVRVFLTKNVPRPYWSIPLVYNMDALGLETVFWGKWGVNHIAGVPDQIATMSVTRGCLDAPSKTLESCRRLVFTPDFPSAWRTWNPRDERHPWHFADHKDQGRGSQGGHLPRRLLPVRRMREKPGFRAVRHSRRAPVLSSLSREPFLEEMSQMRKSYLRFGPFL